MATLTTLTIDILFNKKGLKNDIGSTTATLEKARNSFSNLFVGVGGSLLLGKMVNDFQKIGVQLAKLSMITGESINDIQAWGTAVEKSGGSVEALNSTLQSLSSAQQELAITGKSGALFTMQRLGINARNSNGELKNATQILKEFANATRNIDTQKTLQFGRAMGISDDVIIMMKRAGVGLDALIEREKKLAVYTKEDIKLSLQFQDTLAQLNQLYQKMSKIMASMLIPLLDKLANTLGVVMQNTAVVKGVFTALSVVIASSLVAGLVSLAKVIVLVNLSLIKLIATTLIWTATLLANPITWVVLGIVALIGAIVGLIVYWDKVRIAFLSFWDSIKGFGSNIAGFFSPVLIILQDISNIINSIIDSIAKVVNFFQDATGMFGLDMNKNVNVNNAPLKTMIPSFNKMLAPEMANVGATNNSSNTNNNVSSNVNIGKVEVVTQATEPSGIAKGIKNAIQQNPLVNLFDVGIQ